MCTTEELLDVREQFPIFVRQPELLYLDSAATTQKPATVLCAVEDYLVSSNANAGRGSYLWADATTELIESAKARIKAFLGDRSSDSSVTFNSGASEGLRAVASWLAFDLRDGDEIIVPDRDHSANWLAWSDMVESCAARDVKVVLRTMPYTDEGEYNLHELAGMVNARTRFVAVTQVHHVYGNVIDLVAVRAVIGIEPMLCVDAAQSFGHCVVEVADADFVVFSGHKAMALTGTGGVWAANRRGVLSTFGWQGTPNVVGIVSLAAAIDWFESVGMGRISSHIGNLTEYVEARLFEMEHLELVGRPTVGAKGRGDSRGRHGIVSFRCDGIDAGTVGEYLDSVGIMVRADSHCQANALDVESVRVSLHAYNSLSEIDLLLLELKRLPFL